MSYYTNELNKIKEAARFQIMDDAGNVTKWMDINAESVAAFIARFNEPAPRVVEFTRIKSDVNGNPRFVMHFTQLLKPDELSDRNGYEIALKRARKFGGRKFHNKQYNGGIVFCTYSLDGEVRDINRALGGEVFSGYNVD